MKLTIVRCEMSPEFLQRSIGLLFLLFTFLNRVSPQECQHSLRVERGENLDLQLHNFTTSHKRRQYCTLKVSAEKNMRIILDLVYAPPPQNRKFPIDCASDYVHVGNDFRRVDVDLMTSYKFCGEDTKHELISRSNEMWLVYKSTQKPRHFYISIQAQSPVICTREQFACSPVQCVQRSQICDGVKDCRNGHDEFCHRVDLTATEKDPKEPCFRCGDGTCIQPRLSRYDVSYGRALWYLCDGFSHCPDAWDERKDICLSLDSRIGTITECIPYDLQFGHNGSVVMWNEIRCDDRPDCYFGDDEDGCHSKDNYDELSISGDALALRLGLTLGILTTVCLTAFVVYKIRNASHNEASRPSTTSTVDTACTQCTTGDEDAKENGSNALSVSDVDDDDQSCCSVKLKNTTV